MIAHSPRPGSIDTPVFRCDYCNREVIAPVICETGYPVDELGACKSEQHYCCAGCWLEDEDTSDEQESSESTGEEMAPTARTRKVDSRIKIYDSDKDAQDPIPALFREDYLNHLKKKWDHHQVKEHRNTSLKQRESYVRDACNVAAFQFTCDIVDYLLSEELEGRHAFTRSGLKTTPTCTSWLDDSGREQVIIQIKKKNTGIWTEAFVRGVAIRNSALLLHDGTSFVFDPGDIYQKLVEYVVPGVITKDWTTFC